MGCEILLEKVNKKYGSQTVLCDVSAHFEPGKIYGIIGRNGSGKTVLLKCIAGFIQDYSGRITIDGTDRKKIPIDSLLIGAIIETPGFVRGYSGFQNLKFLANVRHRIQNDAIRAAMESVGLDPKSRKHVNKYSMGMRQRLGIAQALMENPPLFLLDEPMNGLDNQGVREIRELFKQLRTRGNTLLMASHNPLDIEELCDKVYEMDQGRLAPIG